MTNATFQDNIGNVTLKIGKGKNLYKKSIFTLKAILIRIANVTKSKNIFIFIF